MRESLSVAYPIRVTGRRSYWFYCVWRWRCGNCASAAVVAFLPEGWRNAYWSLIRCSAGPRHPTSSVTLPPTFNHTRIGAYAAFASTASNKPLWWPAPLGWYIQHPQPREPRQVMNTTSTNVVTTRLADIPQMLIPYGVGKASAISGIAAAVILITPVTVIARK